MNKKLTTKKFWEDYWASKELIKSIPENYLFHELFNKYLDKGDLELLEIGGFPGYYAIFFGKYFGYKTTILDFLTSEETLARLAQENGIDRNSITCVESDIFSFETSKKYDVVVSFGFLEHFENTKQVIDIHWNLLKEGGTLLIGIPNFLGVNGIIQLLFDPGNLNKHNLDSMNISRLRDEIDSLKPIKSKVFYWGGLRVWLEKLRNRNIFQKIVIYSFGGIGLPIRWIGINNRLLSSYIFIYGKK